MNAELPPFTNGEHNSESVSTIDRVMIHNPFKYPKITPKKQRTV